MIRKLIPVLVWGILGTAMPSSAEPVRVTSGSYFVDSGDDGEWTFAGLGFSLQGLGLGDLPFWHCLLCPSGTQVSMDAKVSPDGNRGPVTWQGQTYTGVYWSGDLSFDAGTATAGFGVEATSPFAFAGTLTAFADELRTQALFSTALIGSGTAWIRFYDFDPSLVDGNEVATVQYTFEADAAPVPEPTTMLLLSMGLAGVAMARRRRGSDR